MATKTTKKPATAQHTQGPWKFIEGRADRQEMSRIVKADDPEFLIGYVLCDHRNQHQRAEDIANARLLAASDCLLKTLERIAGLQEELDGEDFEVFALQAEKLAREAIAKAKDGA